ncbi:hypothetical protein K1719_026084 [Acacia pycnantha]|nr:hypothetical protein K1719_026084 [Acacia pycnantha]
MAGDTEALSPAIKVAALCGSLRKAIELSKGDIKGMEIEYIDISTLPMLNTDLESNGTYPPEVEAFRQKILAADSVLFARSIITLSQEHIIISHMAIVIGKQSSASVPISTEENDLINRSSKKLKNDDGNVMDEEWPRLSVEGKNQKMMGRSFAEMLQGISYKENEAGGSGVGRVHTTDAMTDDVLTDSETEDSEPLCANVYAEKMKMASVSSTEENSSETGIAANRSPEDHEVWKVVKKHRRRRNENQEKGSVNPKTAMGSRFGVLEMEGEKSSEGGLTEGPAASRNSGRTEVSELMKKPKSDLVLRNRGKIGGKSNLRGRDTQGRKDKMGGSGELSLQRMEKRNRGEEYDVEKRELVRENDGKALVEIEGCERMSEQDMEEGNALNGEMTSEVKNTGEGFVLDPGEGEPVEALEGKFWANSDLGPECSLVEDSVDDSMGIDVGPQGQGV